MIRMWSIVLLPAHEHLAQSFEYISETRFREDVRTLCLGVDLGDLDLIRFQMAPEPVHLGVVKFRSSCVLSWI